MIIIHLIIHSVFWISIYRGALERYQTIKIDLFTKIDDGPIRWRFFRK